jgi:penicillin-binding protein 2
MKTKYPELKWTSAHTANASIGQGYVLASPLQMAAVYAAVANGGIAYEPRLIKTVLTPDGKPALDDSGQPVVPDQPKVRGDLRTEVTKEQIEIVRHGLWMVVNDAGGTGARGRVKGITVAGKTGSAQSTDRGKQELIAWFTCFAPYEKPRYAMCVMVQAGEKGGHGGTVAAPIAAHILEQFVAMEQGSYKVELTSLTPAHNPNPFQRLEALTDYKNAGTFNITPAADDEGAEAHGTSASNVQMGATGAAPDIRADADARGKVQQGKPQPALRPADNRNFFQKFFGAKPTSSSTPRPAAPSTHSGH